MRALEKSLCGRAQRIIVLMPKAVDYIQALGVPAEKISWIPNGFDRTDCPRPTRPANHREFVLMYFGGHGNANMLDMLFDALVLVKDRQLALPLKVRLIGNGPLKPALMVRAHRDGLDFVQFEDAVPRNRIPAVSAEADGFIVCLADLPLYRFGISLNKLFDYLAAGRPVILAGNPANNPVDEARAGITVKPEPLAMADAIADLVAMPLERRYRCGENARRHVEDLYTYDNLARQLGEILDDVVAGGASAG
jgi:glycosyltransferase involved in cell wall biosynthesis